MTPSKARHDSDHICSAFHKLLVAGRTPEIEEHLHSVTGLDRTRLFSRLLEIELRAKTLVQETDAIAYIERFPEFAALVVAACHTYAPTAIADIASSPTICEPVGPDQDCPLFPVVPQDILHRHSTEEFFAAGEFLMRQNEVGDSLMVVQQGTVEITVSGQSGETHLIGRAGPGDIIGEMALLTSEPRTASVCAIDRVQILRISAASFYQLVEQYTDLGAFLTQLVASRLEKGGCDSLTEKVLNGYRIRRQIGQGSMGIVYEADDLTTNRRVALKMMNHRLVYSRDARARFQQEADLIQSLDHPNIVRSYNRFDAFHTCFIAMEYCKGRTLRDLIISESPLSEDLCRKIIGGVAAAIRFAHSSNIVHLDLKPSNVMVTENGNTKLMDFGLAQMVNETGQPDDTISGTVRYMAPEQRLGAVRDCRADYFALGCIAWEMFSGGPLFCDSAGRELARDFSKWNPPNWSHARVGVDCDICAALVPSLAVEPADRNLDIDQIALWSSG
ncbi:MAG: protein kinase [Fuerstiella sp.]|nr:protein kinase [Fuerstiella sp.]